MRGMTLVELLVVMLILVLLVAVVPVALYRSGEPSLPTAARDLAAFLRLARSEAVTGRQSVAVWLDTETHDYGMTDDSADGGSLPGGIHVTMSATADESDARRGVIRFFADGSSSGGTIELDAGGAVYELKVDWLTGRIKLAMPDGNG